jgi:hypothetical protein
MTQYRVTAIYTQRELIDFLDANGSAEVKIEVVQDRMTAPQTSANGPRHKRGSRVIDIIIDRLQQGPAVAGDMKHALEVSGLSSNSLSTGLAILQKDGRVKRGEGGRYELVGAEA